VDQVAQTLRVYRNFDNYLLMILNMEHMKRMNPSTGAARDVDGSGAFADCASGSVPGGQSPRRRIRNTRPYPDALFRLGQQERIVLFKLAIDGREERRDRSLPEGEISPGGFRQKRRNRTPRI
jgi:hypothetical protein